MHASSRDDKDMKDLHTRNVKSVLRLKPMHAIIQLKKTYYSCDIAIVEDSHVKPLDEKRNHNTVRHWYSFSLCNKLF